jgi:hypothetical protein
MDPTDAPLLPLSHVSWCLAGFFSTRRLGKSCMVCRPERGIGGKGHLVDNRILLVCPHLGSKTQYPTPHYYINSRCDVIDTIVSRTAGDH